jgi:hypothetical protein
VCPNRTVIGAVLADVNLMPVSDFSDATPFHVSAISEDEIG